jgi:hypothetical protein
VARFLADIERHRLEMAHRHRIVFAALKLGRHFTHGIVQRSALLVAGLVCVHGLVSFPS